MTLSDHGTDFRELFADEAATRLARLSEQLLELEQTDGDADLVASIFREAHTIKGAAAVVGIDEASQVAHASRICSRLCAAVSVPRARVSSTSLWPRSTGLRP